MKIRLLLLYSVALAFTVDPKAKNLNSGPKWIADQEPQDDGSSSDEPTWSSNESNATASAIGIGPLPGDQAGPNPPDTAPDGALNQVVSNALQRPLQGPNAAAPPAVSSIQTSDQIQQLLASLGYNPVQGVDGATACHEFIGYFTTVSAALNSMFTAQDSATIQRRAAIAYMAENNEAFAASNMFSIATNGNDTQIQQQALQAMQLILLNTPYILNGFQSIYQDPSPENAAAQAQAMGLVRNQNILPSVTDLCQASMTVDGSDQGFALNAQLGQQQIIFATRTFLPPGAQGNLGFDNQGQAIQGGFNQPVAGLPASGPIMQTIAGGSFIATNYNAVAKIINRNPRTKKFNNNTL